MPRGDHMTEFMQHDAGEHGRDQQNAVDRRPHAGPHGISRADPCQKKQEGYVQADRRAAEPADRDGPGHAVPSMNDRLPREHA